MKVNPKIIFGKKSFKWWGWFNSESNWDENTEIQAQTNHPKINSINKKIDSESDENQSVSLQWSQNFVNDESGNFNSNTFNTMDENEIPNSKILKKKTLNVAINILMWKLLIYLICNNLNWMIQWNLSKKIVFYILFNVVQKIIYVSKKNVYWFIILKLVYNIKKME